MHRDYLDGPPPKYQPHRPTPPPVEDYWGHIRGTAKKVTQLTSSQSSASSQPKNPDIQISAVTPNEQFIANQILKLSDINELCTACSDPSGEKFQALSAPLNKRLSQFIEGETINPEHVLFLLRKELKIAIP